MSAGSNLSIPFPVKKHKVVIPPNNRVRFDDVESTTPHNATIPLATQMRNALPATIPIIDTSSPGAPVVGSVDVKVQHRPPTVYNAPSRSDQPIDKYLNSVKEEPMPAVLSNAETVKQKSHANIFNMLKRAQSPSESKQVDDAIPLYRATFTTRNNDTATETNEGYQQQYKDVIVTDCALIFVTDLEDPMVLPSVDYPPGCVAVELETHPGMVYFASTLPTDFDYAGLRYYPMLITQAVEIDNN